ncbi:UNVERIFIED_CONTAM: hypothetical protein Sradi_0043200 [Sesamum radiatum]|uniref:Uncharacterized protein n=1 Tax=Sesamum radiatum TaxID=300843 RepID=A0AAW2WHT9_SESRA
MAMAQEARSLQLPRLKNTTSKENDDRLTTNPSCRGSLRSLSTRENNTRSHSLQEPLGELKQSWNSFILTSAVQ